MKPEEIRLGNAPGYCKTPAQVEVLVKTPITYLMIGAMTWPTLPGNEGDVFCQTDRGGRLNFLGMPNEGLEGGINELSQMVEVIKRAGKEAIVNIAGFTARQYADLAHAVHESGANGAELNFGCPNVEKAIVSFDLEQIGRIMGAVSRQTPTSFPLALKLSPYSDPGLLAKVATLINEIADTGNWRKRPLSVVLSNTFPNAFAYRPDSLEPLISGSGLAGYSGPGYKPIVLGQVIQFRNLLHSRITITAVGDIQTGRDILEYETAGAIDFQIGNAFMWEEDFRVFERVIGEYADLD